MVNLSQPPPCFPTLPPISKSVASLSSHSNIIDVDGNDKNTNKHISFSAATRENIKNNFSFYSFMVNVLSANFSSKNSTTLPVSSMFLMVQSLIKSHNKILEEARNTTTIAVFNGDANSTLYNDVNATIPSVLPIKDLPNTPWTRLWWIVGLF